MQVVLAVFVLLFMGLIGVTWFKVIQFKHPKAAFWYSIAAYCMSNGDAEMYRIERLESNFKKMEEMCGGKVDVKEPIENDRQTQNS